VKRKLILSLAAGIILSASALFLAFRNVPFGDLITYFATIRYGWVLPTILLVVVSYLLRALRWQMILNTSNSVGFRMSYHPLTIGFMANTVLPGRIGEAVRPLLLYRKEGVPFTTGLATVAAERIFDAGFLLMFLSLALATFPLDALTGVTYGEYHLNRDTLWSLGINMLILCLILAAAVSLIAVDRTRVIINRMIHRGMDAALFFSPASTRRMAQRRISMPITRLLNHAATGFLLFKHPSRLALCTGVTLLIWFVNGLSYYTMSLGCPGVDLSLMQISLVMVIICFFIALPSVPGYWGIWEAGGVFAMTLFGVSPKTAAGFTLANHAVQLFPVFIMGFSSSIALSVNIRQVAKSLRTG
jgi:uncharacterized protein (TIRG00374 family)